MEWEKENLSNIRLFNSIEQTNIIALLKCIGVQVKSFKKGDWISLSGDYLYTIGLVYKGSVHMVKEDYWGKSSIFVIMEEGELFGETYNCSSHFASHVSFIAATNTTILFIPFHRVLHTCENKCFFHQKLTANMVEQIALKNIQFIEKLEVTSKKTIREKVLTYLSQNLQNHDKPYFTSPLGRIELADYLGVDRSALTRELVKLKKERIIDYDKNTYRLL